MGTREPFWDDGIVLNLDCGGDYTCACVCWPYHTVSSKCMYFSAKKLYFIKVILKTYLLRFGFSRTYIDSHLILRVYIQDLPFCIIYDLVSIVPDIGRRMLNCYFLLQQNLFPFPLHVCNTSWFQRQGNGMPCLGGFVKSFLPVECAVMATFH